MRSYYNEHDREAADWLRDLIRIGAIADGDVDERSIEDVRAEDLDGYTQCHFFAGIGGWSLALRLAGWPDDRPVWTGSCPCQPFSGGSAVWGAQGFDDDRHLWPAWFPLIEQRKPLIVFGEQVAGAPGLAWLDLVSSQLEGANYAVGAVDLCAAGVGAPHIRQRLYWVADHARTRLEGYAGNVDKRDEPGRHEPRSARPVRNAGVWDRVAGVVCRDGRYRPLPMAHGIPGGVDERRPSHEPITAVEQRRTRLIKGYGNAIVPALAAEFVASYIEIEAQR